MDVDWVRVFTRDETEPEIPEKPEYPVEKFDYSRAVVEKRVFDSKMYWYPIPESEILQLKNWKRIRVGKSLKRNIMLKIKILIIIFCCIGVVKAQTVIPPSSETPPGWIYYDGDEFNGDVIDSRYWGIYGSPKVGRPTYNQENKAMLQTYRPEQVFIETLPTGEKICRIRSFKSKDAPSPVHPV